MYPLLRSQVSIEAENIAEAMAACQTIIDSSPDLAADWAGQEAARQDMAQSWAGALYLLSSLHEIRGHLQLAADICQPYLARSEPVYGLILIRMAAIHLEQDEIDQAEQFYANGAAQMAGLHWPVAQKRAGLVQARLLRARRDWQGAIEALETAMLGLQEQGADIPLAELAGYRAVIHAQMKLNREAAAWADSMRLTVGRRLSYRQGVLSLQLARVRLALQQWQAAGELLSKIEAAARAGGNDGWLIETLLLQALLAQHTQKPVQAVELLEQALRLAEPEGFVRCFLDEGEDMLTLLQQVQDKHGDVVSYFNRLLPRLLQQPPVKKQEPVGVEAPAPLSARELEVLTGMAQGLANKEIAMRLQIALGTVKRHTANIFRKLGVDNRIQAVATAREQGIIPW